MPDLYTTTCATGDHRDQLRVSGRHTKPRTDELLVVIGGVYDARRRSAVLTRAQVRALHAALGEWLAAGWPDVPKREDDHA